MIMELSKKMASHQLFEQDQVANKLPQTLWWRSSPQSTYLFVAPFIVTRSVLKEYRLLGPP